MDSMLLFWCLPPVSMLRGENNLAFRVWLGCYMRLHANTARNHIVELTVHSSEFRVQSSEFRVQSSDPRDQGSRLRAQSSEFRGAIEMGV